MLAVVELPEILPGIGLLALHQLLRRAGKDEMPPLETALRPQVDDVISQLYHLQIVLDDDDGVPRPHQSAEGPHERPYVVYVEAGGRLVEDEEALRRDPSEVGGELEPLALPSGERRGRLPQMDVPQPHITQHLQPLEDGGDLLSLLRERGEEVDRLLNGHLEKVVDILVVEGHLEDVVLEALAVALLTEEPHVGHKLHLHGDVALALTIFAPAALAIEGEVSWSEAHLPSQRLLPHQRPQVVVEADVGGRVGARAESQRILIHILHPVDGVKVASQPLHLQLDAGEAVEQILAHPLVEQVLHQRTLAGAAHPGDHSDHSEGDRDVDILQIVSEGTLDVDGVGEGVPLLRPRDHHPPRQVLHRQALALTCRQLRRAPLVDDLSTEPSRQRSQVDQVIRRADHLLIVLHDDDGIAGIGESPDDVDQEVAVPRMESYRGLVEDIKRTDESTAERGGEIDPLTLAPREGPRDAVEGQVPQAYVDQEPHSATKLIE